MARPTLSTAELFAASQRCADVFIDARGSSAKVTDLAAAARLSERTFYRYFPTKEDSLRPLFDDGMHRYATVLAAQPTPGDAAAAITRAASETFENDDDAHTRALMTVVVEDPALRRIWLEASYETARLLRPSIAALIGSDDDVRTSVLAGQAALLVIVAIEHLIRFDAPISTTVDDAARSMFGPPTEQPPKGSGPSATPTDAASV